MAFSSIHIRPIKPSSEAHNLRKNKLDYVREDLTPTNFHWQEGSISELMDEIKIIVKEKTGRSLQQKATPLREGVFLFESHHSNDDLLRVVKLIEHDFGIRAVQLHVHRDEGHKDIKSSNWKPNLHAHVVFDWMDHKTGKSFKLDKEDLSKLQTHFAIHLNMQRGKRSVKSHILALDYKIEKKREDLQRLQVQEFILEHKKKSIVLDKLLENHPELKKEAYKLFIETKLKDKSLGKGI